MNKKESLEKAQLYIIVDPKLSLNPNIEEVVSLAIEGGAQMIQFRNKESSGGRGVGSSNLITPTGFQRFRKRICVQILFLYTVI